MKNSLPLILTNKSTNPSKNLSEIYLDSSNINSFGNRFSKLKHAYLSSNIKTIKKSTTQNSYTNNTNLISNEEQLLKQEEEESETYKKNLKLEEAVFRADYIAKFKKIKLNLYKNKFMRKKKVDEKNNELKTKKLNIINTIAKRNSLIQSDNLEEEDKNILKKYLWGSEIKIKNDFNYDIGDDNVADSDDEIELEPERYRYREIQPLSQNRDKKNNIKRNFLYLTELQNSKNSIEYPLPIKNKHSNLNDKINTNNFNIKQIKIIPDKTEKYKNPFNFKKFSSIHNISHFHKIYRNFKNICRKHYIKEDSPSFAFIKSCEKEKIVCNPLGLLKRWGDERSLDMNNQHTGDKYVNCLSSSLKYVNHLNTLEMSNNRLTSKSIEKLFFNIKQNENLLRNLVKLNLSFNNISEKGVVNLINFIEDKNCQMENLNLEGNNLGDKNINNLCDSISQSIGNRLNTINLGKNKITKNAEQGLLSLTEKCSELVVLILRNNQISNLLASKLIINIKNLYSLKILDLSWNLIGDHLIYPFLFEEAVNYYPNQKNLFNNFELDKIKTNMKIIFNKNPLLPKINPNQNSKTKSNDETAEQELIQEIKKIQVPPRKPSPFAEEFSSYIKNPLCPLIHVNISHNNLPYIDCELIAEESKSNRNILGFHVDGNEMKIDQLGFIHPIKQEQKNKNFYSKSQILYEAENYKDIPQVLVSPINKIRNSNNCWVCECWNEVEFSLDINNKDLRPKYVVVKLHLDFENYAPCDMIYKKKNFKLVRMCPPGKVKYFFTVDGNPVYNCYKEFDYKIKEFEKPIKYSFNEEYIEQFNIIKIIDTESDDISNENYINTLNSISNRKYLGEDIDIDIQRDQRDKNNKLISKTIYITNYGLRYVSPNNNIITHEYQSTLKFSIPRPENYSSRNNKQSPWKYSDSIWNYFNYNVEGENDLIYEKMFETDFNMGEYEAIFINEKEFNLAKKFLKDNYKKILNCYITLSSYSGNNVWQITLDILIDWLKGKCGDFLDNEYNLKRIEKILENIYYNKKEVEERGRYKKYFPSIKQNLIRHSFMLFLVEISVDKYTNLKHQTESPFEALQMAFNNFFIKGLDNYEYHNWRKERYYNEEIDNYIKAFIPLIDGLFYTFSKKLIEKREKEMKERESLSDNNNLNKITNNINNEKEIKMTQEDFISLVTSFVNTDEFDMNEIPLIFHISKRLNVNEVSDDNFLYLNFGEFCEALCRVIDIYSPYPTEEKEIDWTWEKRKEQFLIEKIENIMPTLFKEINHQKFNYIRGKFIAPLKNQITSLYIIDYKSNNFYKGYESIFEQNTNSNNV